MYELKPDSLDSMRERYARVIDTISASARRAGRATGSVRLVVVTKLQPIEVVEAALEAGAHILGENYPEEAAEKIEALRRRSSRDLATGLGLGAATREPLGVEWHMVGHIQSRKAKLVAQHFALVHSLDSLKLAQKLDRAAHDLARQLPVLLEFNVGGESGKHGWLAPDEGRWRDLLPDVEAIAALPNLQIRGLMTMPPLSTDPEAGRIYFRSLRRLRDFLAGRVSRAQWSELSMGTSADYPVAIAEGATLVRIGQAILGPRPEAESE
jgi:pyridoxal phosphate enzyme (YggS family)